MHQHSQGLSEKNEQGEQRGGKSSMDVSGSWDASTRSQNPVAETNGLGTHFKNESRRMEDLGELAAALL